MAEAPGQVLLIGYGNPLRSDDGVGQAAARVLANALPAGTASLCLCHQLTPELAERFVHADRVVFLDASLDLPPGTIRCQEIRPDLPPQGEVGHSFHPQALLFLASTLYNAHPRALLCAIGVQNIDFGSELSPTVAHTLSRLEKVIDWLEDKEMK